MQRNFDLDVRAAPANTLTRWCVAPRVQLLWLHGNERIQLVCFGGWVGEG